MAELQREIARLEAGDTWRDDDEVVELEVKRPLDKVIPVRLASREWEELRREARELGVGPTTLSRMWILEKLRSIRGTKKSA
jgi:hypothetical protein